MDRRSFITLQETPDENETITELATYSELKTDFSTYSGEENSETDCSNESLADDIITTGMTSQSRSKNNGITQADVPGNSAWGYKKNKTNDIASLVQKALELDEETSDESGEIADNISENLKDIPDIQTDSEENFSEESYLDQMVQPSCSLIENGKQMTIIQKSKNPKKAKEPDSKNTRQKSKRTTSSRLVGIKETNNSEMTSTCMRKKKLFPCSYCSMVFPFPSHLKRHALTHDAIRPYACSKCTREFSQKYNLVAHMKTHLKKTDGKKCRKLTTKRTTVSCPQCSMNFPNTTKLNRHIRSHTGIKPYACHLCPKEFSQKSYLVSHMRLHSDPILSHACDVCGKTFSFQSNLRRHKQGHEIAKPFICDICGKAYSLEQKLTLHKKIHINDCDVCGKTFSRKSNSKKHMRIHLNERPHACDQCDYKANQKQHLRKHKERWHTQTADTNGTSCVKREKTLRKHLDKGKYRHLESSSSD